jgi:hypothetical protein
MAFITEWAIPAGNFTLPLNSGYTYNMDVDFGDGSAPVHVATYNDANATHNYTVAGNYQISITGTCQYFYINNGSVKDLLKKVIDWGNVGFKNLEASFDGCSNLVSLPSTAIPNNTSILKVKRMFRNCTSLTAIPELIFSQLINLGYESFYDTFYRCTSITSIPANLFRYNTTIQDNAFYYTFYGCSALIAIPTDLFRYNINLRNNAFYFTFNGCTALNSIPADLFRYNTLVSESTFFATFMNCINLASIPTDLFRYNTIVKTYAFTNTFNGCTSLQSIPVDLFKYNTLVSLWGFKGTFYNCSSLLSVPVDLFRYNTLVGDSGFNSTFYGCSNLSTIPKDLFKYNVAVTSGGFNSTFYGCTKLKLNRNIFFSDGEESTRFLNKSVDFTDCFNRSTYTGAEPGEAPALYNVNFGTGTATKTNCFSGIGNGLVSILNYALIPTIWGRTGTFTAELYNLNVYKIDSYNELATLRTVFPLPVGGTIKIYASPVLENLETNANLVSYTVDSDFVYKGSIFCRDGYTYILAVYTNGATRETLSSNVLHWVVNQKPTTEINITSPNYLVLSTHRTDYIHGTIFFNGYFYGCTRGSNIAGNYGCSIIKVNPNDYSDILYNTFYLNKNTSANQIAGFDQVVSCSGFLWVASTAGYLVRINPDDLNYIVFNPIAATSGGQPIGTDGTYLYMTADVAVHKLDTTKLISAFSVYGYDGSASVAVPPGTLLASCNVVQRHATIRVDSHSIVVDKDFIFLNCSACILADGFDPGTNATLTHFQKINKATMQTVGDIIIPMCTDDMVMNGEYVFLSPELSTDIATAIYGANFGLIAINKRTLELKYLKALHTDYWGNSEPLRRTYGVFYSNGFLVVQMYSDKKTILIDTSNVELWDDNFPVGGATQAIFLFKENGALLPYPPNEFILDDNNFAHITIFGAPAHILKFPVSSLGGMVKTPNIQTTLISNNITGATLNGYVIAEGQSPITSAGFKYGNDPLNLINDLAADPLSYDFTELLAGLSPGIYYAKAYGTNTQGTFYGNTVMFTNINAVSLHNNDTIALFEFLDTHFGCSIRCVQDAPGVQTGTMGMAQDQDGNVYDTVVINEKRWMVQNLKTTHFRNGEPVPNITDPEAWQLDEIGGQSAYNNKPANV